MGCGKALKGYDGQRTPGPQMCDAVLCPPFPITVAGTLPEAAATKNKQKL